jgi:hypothetical protein
MVYIVDNIADVTLFMREKYRALLPLFRLFFKELTAKCEFLKKIVNRPEVNMRREWGMTASGVPTVNPWPWKLANPAPTVSGASRYMESKDAKTRFSGIIDSIVKGTNALIQSCDQVLREVGDEPKFLELGQNSIKDFKAQYGTDPLMPLSSLLNVLKNTNASNYTDVLPVHSVGDDEFKFLYGIRMILNQPNVQTLPEHVPGWTQIMESFNLMSDAKNNADKVKAGEFMNSFVKLLRFVYESRVVKGNLTPYVAGIPDTNATLISSVTNKYNPNIPDEKSRLTIGGMFARDDFVVTEKRHEQTSAMRIKGPADTLYDVNGPVVITNKSDVSLVYDQHVANWRTDDDVFGGKRRTPVPAYGLVKNTSEIVKVTESSFKEDRIKDIVEHILGAEEKHNSLEIQNIIDLNIVPINVHALMREVPLANLYNYSYTFDRLIIELYYGFKNDNAQTHL